MTENRTPDQAGQEPPPYSPLRTWIEGHPGSRPPADARPTKVRSIQPLATGHIAGLAGDWSRYILVSWGWPVRITAGGAGAWGRIKWTGELIPDNGAAAVPLLFDRIHALCLGSYAWIEAVRLTDTEFTITPRDFDRCQSEQEGVAALRGWRLLTFLSRSGGHSKYTEDEKREILERARVLKPGRTWDQVGTIIGPSGATLWRWDKKDREKPKL